VLIFLRKSRDATSVIKNLIVNIKTETDSQMIEQNDVTKRNRHLQTIEQKIKIKRDSLDAIPYSKSPSCPNLGILDYLDNFEVTDVENKQFMEYLNSSAKELHKIINETPETTFE
jgi:hypothetical protein